MSRERLAGRWGALVVAALLLGAAPPGDAPLPSVPDGFEAQVFASGLGAVRFMAVDPAGTLLASIPDRGMVIALPDRDADGRADRVQTVATDLDRPHGLAFRGGRLYVAETGRVVRFTYDPATPSLTEATVVVPDLPAGGHHWTRTIAFGRDGGLYVAIGSSCDVCRERDPRRATVMRYEVERAAGRPFATGLRSVVGLAVHPRTGVVWVTINERDWRAGGAPPDYVTELRDGGFYGWPGCFAEGGRVWPDPELRDDSRCAETILPSLEIAAHSAPLGLAFYTGRKFPRAYRGNLFVAYHGSRPGLQPLTGHKVVRVALDGTRPPQIHDFMTGFVQAGRVTGRPVDVVTGADGALYVSDDHAGRIYRVTRRS